MASILDIAPLNETVQGVPVYGISAHGVAHLLAKFPQLRAVMAGRSVDEQDLFALGGEVVAEIIAAGTGNVANEEVITHVKHFNAEQQVEFLSVILRLTMPRGVAPFMETVGKLADSLNGGAASTVAPATKSRKPSRRSSPADTIPA